MWGDGYDNSFWGYGYGDIYAGLFAPYGYDELTGYLPQYDQTRADRRRQRPPVSPAGNAAAHGQLAQMCGQDSRDIAGLPIDQFQQAIQPTDAQRAALDDLANASLKAAQDIKAACPTDIALTAPSRLAAMQHRIEAMIAAVARHAAAAGEVLWSPERRTEGASDRTRQRSASETGAQTKAQARPRQACGAAQPDVMEWPTAEIDRTVRPTEAQRASLVALQDATAKAAEMLKASCPTDNPLTPPARLAAVGNATRNHDCKR